MEDVNSIPKHISKKEIASGDQLKLSQYTYLNHNQVECKCDVVERKTVQNDREPQCVGAFAMIQRMLRIDALVLVKQYRPSLKAYTLEFPAGLTIPGEKTETTAQRELKEETGYTCTGEVKHTSPLIAMDPGLSNSTMKIVTLDIDGDEFVNKNPLQNLKDKEAIEVVYLPFDNALSRLNEFTDQGVVIDSRIYCFALGMVMGKEDIERGQRFLDYIPLGLEE